MKNYIKEFLKQKLNISLFILEVVAIILFCLGRLEALFFSFGMSIQGLFFVVLGIKMIIKNKKIFNDYEIVQTLPYDKKYLDAQKKKTYDLIKNNKFLSIAFWCMGALLIFVGFSYLV